MVYCSSLSLSLSCSLSLSLSFSLLPCLSLALSSPLLLSLLQAFNFLAVQLGRHYEYEADKFAQGLGRAEALCGALIKLVQDNLSFPIADPLYSRFNHIHPTMLERIRTLREKKKVDWENACSQQLITNDNAPLFRAFGSLLMTCVSLMENDFLVCCQRFRRYALLWSFRLHDYSYMQVCIQ